MKSDDHSQPCGFLIWLTLLVGTGLALAQPCAGAPFQFQTTGSLITARDFHTATLLPNGHVLLAGGVGTPFAYLASAELYDPATGILTTTGSLAVGRLGHTATLLRNGKVLVVGGDGSSGVLASAELYDPTTGTWTTTGSLTTARFVSTSTLLTNGKVLVVGGEDNSNNILASAELYDPVSGTWTPTGSLTIGRYSQTATLLPDGNVLVAGELVPLLIRRARNSTIRRVAPGPSRAALPLDARLTRRRCCLTERCS
jgi:WD40 repeat protein